MQQKILLLIFFSLLSLKEGEGMPSQYGMASPNADEFPKRMCATNEHTIILNGTSIKTVKCSKPGLRNTTESLSGTLHWCLQDYLNITSSLNSRSRLIPSGCSMWVMETDDVPMKNIDVIIHFWAFLSQHPEISVCTIFSCPKIPQ